MFNMPETSQSGNTISPRVIHGVIKPYVQHPEGTYAVALRVDESGSLYTTAKGNASSFDMFKYQVGVDKGTYNVKALDNVITLSSDFNSYRRDQFPKFIYNIADDSFHVISGFTGSVIVGGITRSMIDVSTLITTATSESLMIKYNSVENAYDVNANSQLNTQQNPPWMRYTATEALISTTFNMTSSVFQDLGAEIDMKGYNQLGVWLTVDINTSSNVDVRVLHKHTSAGSEEYRDINVQLITPSVSHSRVNLNDYRVGTNTDQLFKMNIDVDATTPYVQLQVKEGTANGDAQIDAAYITKAWV